MGVRAITEEGKSGYPEADVTLTGLSHHFIETEFGFVMITCIPGMGMSVSVYDSPRDNPVGTVMVRPKEKSDG